MADEASELEALLAEYFAVRKKVDAAVDEIAARRSRDLACARGCASCCAAGLTVLGVEAVAIEHHLESEGFSAAPAPPPGGCAFLDAEGACTIYAARPLLCRTHGLPMRYPEDETPPGRRLPLVDEARPVTVCELNFKERLPAAEDILDATTVQALLTTVDARFRDRVELGVDERFALAAIAAAFTSEG